MAGAVVLAVGLSACGKTTPAAITPGVSTTVANSVPPSLPATASSAPANDVPVTKLDIGALPLAGGAIQVTSRSCWSTGNCLAGGTYSPQNHDYTFGWLAEEIGGKWHKAFSVPGLDSLDVGGDDGVSWVDCPGAGACSAGGAYDDDPNAILVTSHLNVWVADEVDGHWDRSIAVPGLSAFNSGDLASLDVGTCPAVGDCEIAGSYMDANATFQRYTESEIGGVWQSARELGSLQEFGDLDPTFTSLTCSAVDSCQATGTYSNGGTPAGSFKAIDNGGVWRITGEAG